MTDVHRIRVFDYNPSPIVSTSLLDDTLLVARESGYVEIWSVERFAHCMCSFVAASQNDIRSILWLTFRGEKAFAIGTLSGEIVIFSYPSLTIVAQSTSFGGTIWCAATNDEKNLLAIACEDRTVKLFSTADDLSLVCTSDSFPSKCLSVCFGHDGQLYAGDATGKIGKIDPERGQLISRFDVSVAGSSGDISVWALCSLINGQLASGDSNGNVIIWDTNTSTVDTRFSSHQADILALASSGKRLYAAGIDPTIITFELNDDDEWIQRGQKRYHTHDVTSISVNSKTIISAGLDACIYFKGLVLPFQNPVPVACAVREDGNIIAVGAEGNQVSIWKLTGENASLELKLKTQDPVDAVAISSDASSVAYSATNTRIVKFDSEKKEWALSEERRAKASVLCFAGNELYSATIGGEIYTSSAYTSLGFPIFKLAVTSNAKFVVATGLTKSVCLKGTLQEGDGFPYELPYMGASVSATTFRTGEPLLFSATSANKILAYDVKQRKLIPSRTFNIEHALDVAPYSISFSPDDHDKLLVVSSMDSIVINLKREVPNFHLPYDDYLFSSFVKGKRLVVYEKPWAFMMHSLPMPFRIKRFQGSEETKTPRY